MCAAIAASPVTSFLASFLRLASISVSISTGLVVTTSLGGCIPQRVDPGGNGESGSLDFQIEETTSTSTTIATGFEAELFVQRFDDQWRNCEFSKSVGLAPQSCTSINNEPIDLIDVSCDGCTAIHDVDQNGGVRFKISSDHDGVATLHVDVKSKSSSATWGDSFPLHFATATRLVVQRQSNADDRQKYAVLPGASFQWCPVLESADSVALFAPSKSFTSAVVGAALQIDPPGAYSDFPSCVLFHAANPGASTISFQAGSLSQSAILKVADPNQIASAALFTVLTEVAPDADLDATPTFDTTPITKVTFTTYPQGLDLVSVLTMKDGSLALGGAGRYVSSSQDLLEVNSYGSAPEIAESRLGFASVPDAVGTGTIDATFGALKISIPFSVTDAAATADAGTD